MPLHASAEMMMGLMVDSGMVISPDSTPESARAAMAAVAASGIIPKHEIHAVEDRTVPGPGGDIPVRVYRPSSDAALPVVVYLHGGGWVIGSIESHDQLCRQLCDDAGAIVVSVDYRLAPETKFPGAVDDCVAAWRWVTEHAAELGGDPARVAVAGDSAGGNLAAVIAQVARDEKLAAPVLQLLVYPATDYEFESPSMIDNAKGYFLEAFGMRWFYDHYARTPADFDDPRFSPARTASLAGLAPAFVVTAEFDPLRDQGEAYAQRLREAGVPAEAVRGDGLFHGFFGLHEFVPEARDPWDAAVRSLRAAFGNG
jgi:acetyl esterase